jgi:PAS domain S-box-containing protein
MTSGNVPPVDTTATELQRRVSERFGLLPNFFRLSPETPEITEKLWGFAEAAYLDNPLPSIFKERLFVYLSRFCAVRYCIARHTGFLIGLGRPAGDKDARVESVDAVVKLLRQPLSRGADLDSRLADCLKCPSPLVEIPAANSEMEGCLFSFAAHVFLQTPNAPECLDALERLLGPVQLQYILLFLAFVRAAHYWTRVHPEIQFEDDIKILLATHEALAGCIVQDPEVVPDKTTQSILEELPNLRLQADKAIGLLAAIVDSSDDAIVSKTLQGIITSWNTGAERLFGYTAAEAVGRSVTMLIPPDRIQEEREILSRLQNGERIEHFETVRVNRDGTTLDVSLTISPVKDSSGRIIGASKIVRDISARKRVEEALRIHSARYETLLNEAPLGVYVIDAEFRLQQVNPIALPAFGDIPNLIGRDFDEVMHILWEKDYADEIIRIFRHTLATGEPYQTPERLEYRIDREITECYEWGVNRISLDESVYGVVCYFKDISAQVKARIQLAESEERFRVLAESLEAAVNDRTRELERRNADLQEHSDSLRHLSMRLLQAQDHERRHIARELHDSAGQILAALAMNLGSLARRASQASPEFMSEVADSGALVEQLVREIRTTSYLLHPPLLDETGLAGALRWYIDGAKERSGVDIQLSIPHDLDRLSADMELVIFRLVQECLTNIHRHSGGKAATVRLMSDAEGISLEVKDNGKGIPSEKLSKIRSQASGGVGISGMRERVRHFNGHLEIESNESGTTVTAKFPPVPESALSEENQMYRKAGG